MFPQAEASDENLFVLEAPSDKTGLYPFLCHSCYQTSRRCLKPAALMWLKANLDLI